MSDTDRFEHREQLAHLGDLVRERAKGQAGDHTFVLVAVVSSSSLKRTQRLPRFDA
jgi:hypothetical protein